MYQRNKNQVLSSNLSLPQLAKNVLSQDFNQNDEKCSKTIKSIGPNNTLRKFSEFQSSCSSTSLQKDGISKNFPQKMIDDCKLRKEQCSRANVVLHQQEFVDQFRNQIQYKDYFIGGIKDILSKEKYCQNLKQMCIDQLNQIYKNVTCKVQTFNPKKQMPNIVLSKKYSIALDLDETLVHSEEIQPNRRYDFQNFQFGTFIRPYSKQFLQMISKHANLFIFTSSNIKYATTIAQILDPNQEYFQGVFFRDHCTVLKDNTQTKDINIISDDLTKILLIDNNPQCFIPQPLNGIPIIPFLDNKADKELLILSQFLEREIFNVENVQQVIKRFFQFDQFRQFENGVQAFQILYT